MCEYIWSVSRHSCVGGVGVGENDPFPLIVKALCWPRIVYLKSFLLLNRARSVKKLSRIGSDCPYGICDWPKESFPDTFLLPGARSYSHRCPMFCYGFRVERHVSWKRCAMVCNGVWDTFSLVWWVCQKCQPNQQQRVYEPRGIKDTAAQWVQVNSFNMCLLQLGIRNHWRY